MASPTESNELGESQSDLTANPAGKRRAEERNPQTRTKRNRYISIACNECKRRKIKCNGQTPCQRCGNLSLDCQYASNCCSNFKDSEEFRQMEEHISALQTQVNTLFSNLNDLRTHVESTYPHVEVSDYPQQNPESLLPVCPNADAVISSAVPPNEPMIAEAIADPNVAIDFNDLGSALPNLNTAANTEATKEIVVGDTRIVIPWASKNDVHASKDPLWTMSKAEAGRLCDTWREEVGLMYPLVNTNRLLRHLNLLFAFLDAATRTGFMQKALPGHDAIHDDNTNILKLVIATGASLEVNGQSELGNRVFACVRPHVEARLNGRADVKGIQMLALNAIYHSCRDEERLAGRLIGLAERMCIELGLHRHESYCTMFDSEEERSWATNLFWAVLVLDRQWSFSSGVPCALQDTDIDPLLPKPDGSQPYLNALVDLSPILARMWKLVALHDIPGQRINSEEISYLDYQITQWHQNLPDLLRYFQPEYGHEAMAECRNVYRMRVHLYLRANQMRILIHRPVLYSAASIMEHSCFAHAVVGVARDSIRVVTHVNQTSHIRPAQQAMYDKLLVSAFAILFLAVSNAPARFSEHCRNEFHIVLDFIRTRSPSSYLARRLWDTIKILREAGPAVCSNLQNATTPTEDPHSTAAVAMAGLAGHPVDEAALFSAQSNARHSTNNFNTMADDLANWFEATSGSSILPANGDTMGINGFIAGSAAHGSGGDVLPSAMGNEDELSRMLNGLF